ncbi:MAG: hypothetical protein HY934_02405 [Candidatus Firestonebacteria bacterium]|nr:hypothetical protein [Candidatus Firestonebacteria bacterium]
MYNRIISVMVVIIFALACMEKNSSKQIDFINIYKGTGGPIEPGKQVITDVNSWIEFKKELKKEVLLTEDEIDFEKYMIIAVYLDFIPFSKKSKTASLINKGFSIKNIKNTNVVPSKK